MNVADRQYHTKPIVIEALQFLDTTEVLSALSDFMGTAHVDYDDPTKPVLLIDNLESRMNAQVGDWIIKGVKGEFYPCKPDIFAATYEQVPGCPCGFAGIKEPEETGGEYGGKPRPVAEAIAMLEAAGIVCPTQCPTGTIGGPARHGEHVQSSYEPVADQRKIVEPDAPHQYARDNENTGDCAECGRGVTDPVHEVQANGEDAAVEERMSAHVEKDGGFDWSEGASALLMQGAAIICRLRARLAESLLHSPANYVHKQLFAQVTEERDSARAEADALRTQIAGFQNLDAMRQAMVDTADENAAAARQIDNLRATVRNLEDAAARWESHALELCRAIFGGESVACTVEEAVCVAHEIRTALVDVRSNYQWTEQCRVQTMGERDQMAARLAKVQQDRRQVVVLLKELLASQHHQSEYYINTNAGCAIAEALERIKGDQEQLV